MGALSAVARSQWSIHGMFLSVTPRAVGGCFTLTREPTACMSKRVLARTPWRCQELCDPSPLSQLQVLVYFLV